MRSAWATIYLGHFAAYSPNQIIRVEKLYLATYEF